MTRTRRLLRWALVLLLLLAVLGLAAVGTAYYLIAPRLPDVQTLRDVELQVPLSVYTRDGRLIAQFGETRRYPVRIEEVPERVKQAVLAIEDARFYEHPGIDWRGIARAIWLLATTDDRRVPGGSTITQQVARQFFLSSEYSYTRKLTEIFLALKMERELSKDEILGLYLNKSFFGNRAYGIAAAAEFYYGKKLDELSIAEAATLAAIPKFPSSGNPIVNPQRALIRRNYVIERMHEVGYISAEEMHAARAEPIGAEPHEPPIEVEAPYVAEMVRQWMVERYGADALTHGYRAYTTLEGHEQEAANRGVRTALLDYDRRHGWRGAEAHWEIADDADPATLERRVRSVPTIAGLLPALVLSADSGAARLLLGNGETVELPLERMRWARPYIDANRRGPAPTRASDVLTRGDLVRLQPDIENGGYRLAQIPKAQAAFVALDPEDGAIRALVGGFSFAINKFNRATQAQRQPGSSFKPFVYAAAFERGFTPASIVLDAPVIFRDRAGNTWTPQNDNQTFAGPMRLREAMVTSRNLVSVRLLDAIGVSYAHRYIQGFGFAPQSLPENLSMSLGTSSIPPLALARGYAVFHNGGFLVEPYFVERVENREGVTIAREYPLRACRQCPERLRVEARGGGSADGFDLGPAMAPTSDPAAAGAGEPVGPPEYLLAPRAIDERTAYLVQSLLRDVVRRGTGRNALALGRSDLGGKTGSTNEHRDAWFAGFGGPLVAAAWVGMDDFTTLGNGEFGARAALPIWIEFMRAALADEPENDFALPNGIVTAWIDPETGWLAQPGTPGALTEFFKLEDIARLEQRSTAREMRVAEDEAFDIF
ncbi:MAG: penicillin-binding protein 1A [Rehaibacterium terrae]|uniref:penicillin-binding protein 1A n=1 Tax=Rehaibacterium terrae TaxID=1341696 RepID=UPI00391C50A2